MGKKSKYPEYSSGSITVNGNTVATTKRDKNNNIVDSNYNMSKLEKNIYDTVQGGIYSNLTGLLNVSDEKRTEWNNQLKAIKNQGIAQINDIYTPMETDLRNDIASRFGNLDNSIFMDNLNKITDKKAKAISDLSENLVAAESQLYADELNNKVSMISFLNNLNSVMNNNILNFTNAANSNAASGNSYNKDAYNANSQNTFWNNWGAPITNTLLSVAGTTFTGMNTMSQIAARAANTASKTAK